MGSKASGAGRKGSAARSFALYASRQMYWYIAYAVLAAAVLLDAGRLAGSPAAAEFVDDVLGFAAHRFERRRGKLFLLNLLPFAQLSFLTSRPVHVACGVGTLRAGVLFQRVQVLAFLSFYCVYCLFGDAPHHGYFLLRLPDRHRCAAVLLRDHLSARDAIGRSCKQRKV